MASGLRERKRRAMMRTIQEVALDLFDARSFSQVSVEEIAAAAEVSPSSVYRYFGTKEGIILADDFDALTDDELADVIDPDDLVGVVRAIASRFDPTFNGEPGGDSLGLRRVRYFFDEPSVRRASYETLANAVARISQTLADKSNLTASEAHVASSALVFGYFAALEQWHRNPADNPIGDTLRRALDALRLL
ncbi:helix-turn-helix domain-containing protein [Micromonospora zamorensis]|uniref:TetR/AcrR family transcriptional regulator n=1 Tax=Micromonospora zamorensis TaxID=709883 RepID=UPI0033C28FCA